MRGHRSITRSAALAAACSGLAAAGCWVSAEPEPVTATYEVTAAEPPPVDIETEPYVVYEGHPTYFYSGHWYYRADGGRWRYYRREPPTLYRQRPYVQEAPPAPRAHPPPARRVR